MGTATSKTKGAQIVIIDRGMDSLLARVAKLPEESPVQVGVFGDRETARIAALHEFGGGAPAKAPAKTARKPKGIVARARRAIRARVRKMLRRGSATSRRSSAGRGGQDADKFGKPGQGRPPKRSFLRATAEKFKSKYARLAGMGYGNFLDGRWNIQQAMTAVGIEAVADIQAAIIKGIDPKLVKSTVMAKQRKGLPRPKTALYATGKLFNAIRMIMPKGTEYR